MRWNLSLISGPWPAAASGAAVFVLAAPAHPLHQEHL